MRPESATSAVIRPESFVPFSSGYTSPSVPRSTRPRAEALNSGSEARPVAWKVAETLFPAIEKPNVGRSTTVRSITEPGFDTEAMIWISVTALGSEAYWKLPSRTSVLNSKAGNTAPRISPRAHADIDNSPEAVRRRKSRV